MSSNITLITGGSGSGKSTYAESLYKGNDQVLYIATAVVTDLEMQNRINIHRKSRNQQWETAEVFKDLDQIVANTSMTHILLDCVTVMVTNLIFDRAIHAEDLEDYEIEELERNIIDEFKKLIAEVRKQEKNLVLVTNEVGYGLVPEYKLGRMFRDIAGRVNQQLGLLCDDAYLVSCGLPLKLK